MSRLQFVADHQDTFEAKRLCRSVEVGRSLFYAWLAGAQARAQRLADDDLLAERIRQVHQVDRAYGAPRVTAELNDPASPVNATAADELGADRGNDQVLESVNHKRVARVMRERRIVGLRLRRKVRTTIADTTIAESFNAALKRETLQGAARWVTAQQAHLEVFTWITRYNTRRRPSYCGQQSPNTYEQPSTTVTLRPAA